MPIETTLRRVAGFLGLAVVALGGLTLAGWLGHFNFDLDGKAGQPPAMKFNTALSFVFAGLGLWWSRRPAPSWPGLGCASAVVTISLASFAESRFGVRLGLAEFFRQDTSQQNWAVAPGLMLQRTAGVLAAAGIALLFLAQQRNRERRPVSAWLANFLIAVAVASLLARGPLQLPDTTAPALLGPYVSLGILALGVGIILARPHDTLVRTLFSKSTVGVYARRLFFALAILPLLLAILDVGLLERGLIDVRDGVAFFAVAVVFAGFAVALFSVENAVRIDEGREEAEQARLLLMAQLQEQAAHLQETVALRTRELSEANAGLKAAAESNALLALAAQNSANGMIIADREGRVEWVNEAFCRLTGYTADEFRGRKPGELLHGPETDPATVACVRAAVRAGAPARVEILDYRKNGEPFWQLMDMQPVRDSAGRLVNFVSNNTDISAQRADQLRLQQLNARLELATRSARLGVWEWDTVGQRSIWDARTLEIYGLTADRFHGRIEDWVARLHPDDREAAVAGVQTSSGPGDSFEHEFRIIRAADGAVRHVQSCGIVQRDPSGRVIRVTGTDRDVTDEREAVHRTQELNERLRLALRSSAYGVWEYDLVHRRRNWDERVLEIYGLRPEQFDGSHEVWERYLHPEDRAAVLAKSAAAREGAVNDYDLEFRIVRPDGAVRYLESHGHIERDRAGRAVRHVGLSRDITEQKRMAQALELAEQRWQLAIEATNDSIWDWDIATGQIYHDDRWARMLGYDEGELPGTIETWKALVHPDDFAANEAALRDHLAQRSPFYRHELRLRAKDGTWRWILDRGRVVRRAADGRALRMAGTHTDTTERKQLEERLRKTEELANEVSRLAHIGAWEIDLVTARVTWTEGTRRIHDVDDVFLPTLDSIWQFYPPESLAVVQTALRELTPAAPTFDAEVQFVTAGGRRLWVRLLGHGEFDGGKTASVHGAIQDVTARRESEEARHQLEAQLFQAQKMETLGTLAGGIAHDFNNLLTGIIGYHELAADSLSEDHPSRMCLQEARNASLRARELVEQILTFGRQSGGTEHGPLDLSLVIEEARRFLRSTLPANIVIEVTAAPNCGAVLADATQIHQVILNLGSNAAHAMRHQGGTLRIALAPAEITPELAVTLGAPPSANYLRLSVSDTGHGMDESTRRRIFDPFFTTKNTREGTGLGLAVVHGIVRSHRGAIDVESTPGTGAVFHIYLPTAQEEQPAADFTFDAAPRGGGEFVCVVDDEEVVGSCTKLVLESRGYRALIFASAEDCLADLQTDPSRCAVLVTDQTMPGMQGTELAAALRLLKPDLPVVIMSGYFSKISPAALDELGQVELLAKPFTTDELAHAVHRALHPSRPAL